MEFDPYSFNCGDNLFESIARDYAAAGYRLPRLVFWNVSSRTNAIPLVENENGVILIGGFSKSLLEMVMSSEIDPYKALFGTLLNPRYDVVDAIVGVPSHNLAG